MEVVGSKDIITITTITSSNNTINNKADMEVEDITSKINNKDTVDIIIIMATKITTTNNKEVIKTIEVVDNIEKNITENNDNIKYIVSIHTFFILNINSN